MANPNFGKWALEDDVDEIDIFGTAPSAEEEALGLIEKPAPKKNYGGAFPRPEKITVQAKKIFVNPENFDVVAPYGTPFTKKEATEIIKKLEIFSGKARALTKIISTYIAAGPEGKSQAVVIDAAGREVYLYFQHVAGLRWRLVKTFVAENFSKERSR